MQMGEKVPPATVGQKYLLSPKGKVFVLLLLRKEIYLGLCICHKLNSHYDGAIKEYKRNLIQSCLMLFRLTIQNQNSQNFLSILARSVMLSTTH